MTLDEIISELKSIKHELDDAIANIEFSLKEVKNDGINRK